MERRCNLEKYGNCEGCWALSYVEKQRIRVSAEEDKDIVGKLSVALCPPGTKIQVSPRPTENLVSKR